MEYLVKDPTTYQEQLRILKERNMLITDEYKAESILRRVNYYRLSAYMLTLKKDDRFFEGVTFDDVYYIYEFDKRLRHMIMGILEGIEIAFRTHIAYELAHKYGPLAYKDPAIFYNREYHGEMLHSIEDAISKRKDELFVKHHLEKYGGNFPVWVIIEVISFGQLSKMFSNLKNEDKKIISKYYNFSFNLVQNWLYVFSAIRNICAHYGRLYNRTLKIKPIIERKIQGEFDDNRIFAVLYALGKLCLNRSEWRTFITNLKGLTDEYNSVSIEMLGFPNNWEEILRAI
jgi:abortive infection bacteriophage resistance protein